MRKRVTLKLFYLLAAVFIFIIPFTISPMALYVVQILIGFSLGIIFPLLLGMSIESVPADMRTTSTGAYQALYALGIFGGPLAAGFFNDWLGFRAGFYFAGCSGWRLSYLLICGEPMRKNRRKSAGKMRQSITRHDFFICLPKEMISLRINFPSVSITKVYLVIETIIHFVKSHYQAH
ncbi:MFS transporter [Bacillus amyloliquefaciens]|uniref:MFS transporter n=1 Tax=Bacillus amyloliquefaciens TaxID=1390 RepID=UPI001F0FF703|nr:MFS transporter [Bacillus amyloliquefaciens]